MPDQPVFPDPEEFFVSYLSQFATVSVFLPNDNTTWPFFLVQRISGSDDRVTDRAVVSVHSFDLTRAKASDAARGAHRVILALTPKTTVTTSDGALRPDRVVTVESPTWRDWGDDNVQRYVARYQVELRRVLP